MTGRDDRASLGSYVLGICLLVAAAQVLPVLLSHFGELRVSAACFAVAAVLWLGLRLSRGSA